MVRVVDDAAVTVTTSSLLVSGPRMSVYGTDGKPLTDTTETLVVVSPVAADEIELTSVVSIAVAEKFRLSEPGSPAAMGVPYLW
jgi:hypothetical protein